MASPTRNRYPLPAGSRTSRKIGIANSPNSPAAMKNVSGVAPLSVMRISSAMRIVPT